MRLHFTIGCYNCRRTSWCRHGFHFNIIQILFADHVHRRSGVYSKFSFFWFIGLMVQADTNFPKVRRMLFYFFSENFKIFLANFHAASRAHRSCHSVFSWDRSSNLEALGLRWWGSLGQIIPKDGFLHDVTRLQWIEHIGLASVELFRKIVVDFGGSISWHTQPNCPT